MVTVKRLQRGLARLHLRQDRVAQRTVLGAVLLNLVLALLAGAWLHDLGGNRNAAAAQVALNRATLLALDVDQTLGMVDLALKTAVESHHVRAGVVLQEADLERLAARHPALNILCIANAQGTIEHWSVLPPDDPVSVADRPYFARLRDDPAAGLQVSAPLVGRVTGTKMIELARRLADDRGRFDGVVIASVPVAVFASAFESIKRQPSDRLEVRDAQGHLLVSVHSPNAPEPAAAGLVHASARSPAFGFTLEAALSPREHFDTALEQITVALAWLALSATTLLWTARALRERRRQLGDEQALRHSEARFRQFIDNFPGAAYLKDEQSRLIVANRGFRALPGIDTTDLIGKNSKQIFGEEIGAKLLADDHRILASGTPEIIEESWGDAFYETHKFRIGGESGPAMLGGLTLDVTLRHQVAARSRVLNELDELGVQLGEREFLAHGLEQAESLTRSHIGFLHFVNDDQETLELVAWTRSTLRDCSSVHEGHYPISKAGIWADAFRTRRAMVVNDYAGHAAKRGLPEGHTPLQRLVCAPVIEGGKVRLLLGVGNRDSDYGEFDADTLQLLGNDIWRRVARQRADVALRQRVEELAALNQKFASAQNQLLQSEKMASIGQLAAGVAHELNNPIGFIQSNLGTLADYVKDLLYLLEFDAHLAREHLAPPQWQLLEQARSERDLAFIGPDIVQLLAESREGAERVRVIVQNLKDFAHVSDEERSWVDLHKGLDSTLNIVWHALKYKVEVSKQYGEIPLVHCVPGQINQVFMNLLANAGQAIATRGRITLRTGASATEVWVEIEDTGSGIAPEHINRIFEPFFTTKPVGQGTGLGLSLSYSIVAKHGGRLSVFSQLGVGSCFRMTLPHRAAPAAEPVTASAAESSTGSATAAVAEAPLATGAVAP